MIRERVIPVAWLLTACILIGVAAGTKASAEPLTPGETWAVRNAAGVCAVLNMNPSVTGLTNMMDRIANSTSLSDMEVGAAVGTSVAYACPQHLPLLRRFVTMYGTKGATV